MFNEPTRPPIPTLPLPKAVAALVALLADTAEAPEFAPLHSPRAFWSVNASRVGMEFFRLDEPLAFLHAFSDRFGGTVETSTRLSGGTLMYRVATTWHDVHLTVGAEVAQQDVEAQLRHRVAELEARLGGLPATPGELAEQRHLLDPPPVLPEAPVPPTDTTVRDQVADVEAAAAESAQATV